VSGIDEDLDGDVEVLAPRNERQPRNRTLPLVIGMLALCGGFGLIGWLIVPARAPPAAPRPAAAATTPPLKPKPVSNLLTYRADRSGQFTVDAMVNGTKMRFLVDTGAYLVVLTPEDARAAGLNPGTLRYTEKLGTAHGTARAARATLREVRLDQLAVDEVPAVVVMEEGSLPISLLGISFLKRLNGYSIRDGVLTIEW
jgi:aspartyl protease family protein